MSRKKTKTMKEMPPIPDEWAEATDAERLYQQARRACSRIIRELDEEIEAMTRKEDASCTR